MLRRESKERERRRSDAARRERNHAGERTGNRLDDDAALAGEAHQTKSGIVYHGHAGIADERDDFSLNDGIDHLR